MVAAGATQSGLPAPPKKSDEAGITDTPTLPSAACAGDEMPTTAIAIPVAPMAARSRRDPPFLPVDRRAGMTRPPPEVPAGRRAGADRWRRRYSPRGRAALPRSGRNGAGRAQRRASGAAFDAVAEVHRQRALLGAERFELDAASGRVREQARAAAEQYGHEVEAHLVDEARGERLARDIRPTHDADGCRVRDGHRAVDRLAHATRDELEPGAAALDGLAAAARDHEDRTALERLVVAPRHFADIERAASDHERTGGVEHAGGHAEVDLVGRRVGGALGAEAHFRGAVAPAQPVVHALPADAERMLDADARCGGEPVERHRHLEEDVRHPLSP